MLLDDQRRQGRMWSRYEGPAEITSDTSPEAIGAFQRQALKLCTSPCPTASFISSHFITIPGRKRTCSSSASTVRRHDPSVAATARPTGKAAARVDDWVASYASGVSPERR
jgi:hypothetical protein